MVGIRSLKANIRFLYIPLALHGLIVLVGASLRVMQVDVNLRVDIGRGTFIFGNLLTFMVLAAAAYRLYRVDARLRITWGLIALGILLQVCGDIAYLSSELTGDLFSALARILLILGVLSWPFGRSVAQGNRIKNFLDILAILIGATMLEWVFVLGPAIENGQQLVWPHSLLTLAAPAGTMVMVWAASRVLYLQSLSPGSKAQMALGVAALVSAMTDSLYVYQDTFGLYQAGGWLDLGWALGSMLICLAGVLQIHRLNLPAQPPASIPTSRLAAVWMLVPYVWLPIAYILLGLRHLDNSLGGFGVIYMGTGMILGLVIMRQGLALRENTWLSARLRQELARSQQALQALTDSEQRVRHQQERYRILVENQGEGLGAVDWQENFTYSNPAACAVFGVPPGELVGHNLREFTSPETFEQVGKETEMRRQGQKNTYEMQIIRADGERRWLLVTSVPYPDDEGYITGALGIFRDITERKQFEQDLNRLNADLAVARDASEAANHAKSIFLANMSHELRTPLSIIIGYAELLQESLSIQPDPASQERVGRIISSSKHLLALINEVLDFSKIEAGRLSFTPQMVDLDRFLVDLKIEGLQIMEKNQNHLSVNTNGSIGSLFTDPTRLRQVLLNLLSNAAKFTENGNVTLEVQRSRLSQREVVVFKVSDTGIGMTEEQLKLLFQPFQQVDSSTTRKYEGSGLGLAISRRLCQLMGGEIDVASTPGVGTTFTVTVPVSQNPAG